MKNPTHAILLALLFALATSCAHAPATPEFSSSLRIAKPEELASAYGRSFETNPYLEPFGMIRGKTAEFVVMRLDLSLPRAASINLDGRVRDPMGQVLAEAKDLDQMSTFWSIWDAEDPASAKRLTSLERSYLPDYSFVAKPGRRTYYLVLMGKYPLPRPATVEAYLTVEGLEPVVFEAPLPELPSKK